MFDHTGTNQDWLRTENRKGQILMKGCCNDCTIVQEYIETLVVSLGGGGNKQTLGKTGQLTTCFMDFMTC